MEIIPKLWPKLKFFLKILTKIELFRNFYQSQIFLKFSEKSNLSKIFTKIEIFRKYDQNASFLKNRISSITLTKIEILSKIWTKIDFFLKFD